MEELCKKHFDILVPNIIKLKQMYDVAVQKEDKQRCFGLSRLFVDTSIHYVEWIISSNRDQRAAQLINIAISVSAHNDPEISTYVCYFWEKLFEPFMSIAHEFKKKHPSIKQDYDTFERPWPEWAKPYCSGLIPNIIPNIVKSAKLPIEFEDMDRDEQEEAMQIRWQISDVMADICNIIGLKQVFFIFVSMGFIPSFRFS